jgi:hypothetical protein
MMCWVNYQCDKKNTALVSVAGCLGYDVLESMTMQLSRAKAFQLLVV